MNPTNTSPDSSTTNIKSNPPISNSTKNSSSNITTSQSKKPLSQFEISQLSFKNEKLNDEVKSLKTQIISLNDKINEQLIYLLLLL